MEEKGADNSSKRIHIWPILSDEYLCREIGQIPAIAARIKRPELAAKVLRITCRNFPLGERYYLKRIRRSSEPNATRSVDILVDVLTSDDVPETVLTKEGFEAFLTSKISSTSDCQIMIDCVCDPFLLKVVSSPPLTNQQYLSCESLWPVKYHEDKYLTSLIDNTAFDADYLRFIEYCVGLLTRYQNEVLSDAPHSTGQSSSNNSATTVNSANNNDQCSFAAVITRDMQVIGLGHSFSERFLCAHSTMVAIDNVSTRLNGEGVWKSLLDSCSCELCQDSRNFSTLDEQDQHDLYLCTGCDVYLSKEPCPMCACALIHARVRRLFFLEYNAVGATGSCYKLHCNVDVNHRFEVFKINYVA